MAAPGKRILRDLRELSELSPYLYAVPDPSGDLYIIHAVIAYLPDEPTRPLTRPFSEGVYWITLKLPKEYPHGSIVFLVHTPSGRFNRETTVCTDQSHFHASSVHHAVTLASQIESFAIYMRDNDNEGRHTAIGDYTHHHEDHAKLLEIRIQFAGESMTYNREHAVFREAFPGLTGDRAADLAWIHEQKKPSTHNPFAEPAPTKRARDEAADDHGASSSAGAAVMDEEVVEEVVEEGDKESMRPATWIRPEMTAPPPMDFKDIQINKILDASCAPHETYADAAEKFRRLADLLGKARYDVDSNREKLVEHARTRTVPVFKDAPAPPPSPVPLFRHQQDMMAALIEMDKLLFGVLADPVAFGKTFMIAYLIWARAEADGEGKTVIAAQKRLHSQWMKTLRLFGVQDRVILVSTNRIVSIVRGLQHENTIVRVVHDEAHLGMHLWDRPISTWLVTATPVWSKIAALIRCRPRVTDEFYSKHLIRRLPAENTAALPTAIDVLAQSDASPDERKMLDLVLRIARSVLRANKKVGARPWAMVQSLMKRALDAMITGDCKAVHADAMRTWATLMSDNAAVRVDVNRVTPELATTLISRASTGGQMNPCNICVEPIDGNGVLFNQCAHVLCDKCYSDVNARTQKPTCGVPCAKGSFGDVFLYRNVLKAMRDDPKPVAHKVDDDVDEDAADAASAASTARVRKILRICTEDVHQRSVVVARSETEIKAINTAFVRIGVRPLVITAHTLPERMTKLLSPERLEEGKVPLLLIQQTAMRVGLNLQHFHRVVFASSPLDPPAMMQSGARFVRPNASVREVRYYHFYTRGTLEQKLYDAFFKGRNVHLNHTNMLDVLA